MKAIKFTKVSLEKLKHEKNSYRVSDLVTTGLSIEVRAIPSSIKTFYAEWSVISYNKEGRQKRHGARRKICRYGQKPIEAIRNVININLSNWKKTNTQNSSIRTLATLFKEFKKGGVTGFRVKARGQKLKYKPLTTKNYIGLIRTYVLAETNKASTKEMLTAPFRTDGNNYYKKLLKNHISKKLICTNPDLIVHRGNTVEYCAGTIAKIFESLGGQVIYFGKPHKEIYQMCFSKNEKTIAIGDNLNTDIKGANNMNIDSIFISSGVHRAEFKQESELNNLSSKYKVTLTYHQPELIW